MMLLDPSRARRPMGWKIMITISSIIAFYGVGCILYLIRYGNWSLGTE